MTRKKKPLPLLEGIEITDVAAEGKALARVDGIAVFVPYAVPGDIVDLQVRRKKHSFMEAEVARLVKPSPLRVEPFCKHFGVCGGCKWQCLPYEEQLRWKQKQVEDNLQRIGKVELPETSPIKGSQLTVGYRNKLEFGFSNRRWMTAEEMREKAEWQPGVGFHIPGAFDKILDIEECHLMDPVQDRLRNGVRQFAVEHGISFFDLRAQNGVVRNMMVRTALPREDAPEGELMVVMQFCWQTPEEEGQAMQVLDYLKREFPEITSLMYVNNTKCNDTIGDLPVLLYAGRDHLIETMEGLRFKVGPKSFYQTNTLQAYELYKVAREFAFPETVASDGADGVLPIEGEVAQSAGGGIVYDLYTGTGTIANFVAARARQVIGIEYVPEAIEDAKVNAALNGLTDKTLFYAGDMKDILTDDFIREHGRPDVIITDPPRAGMHPDVVQVILNAAPERIVYVSCNPATQARDLQLMDEKYRVEKVQPVDMFPHTHHVENVVLLVRRDI